MLLYSRNTSKYIVTRQKICKLAKKYIIFVVHKYLGCSYAVAVHRYCVDYFKYEGKPVVSFVCVSDKDCQIENIPAWIYEEFEVVLLQLNH